MPPSSVSSFPYSPSPSSPTSRTASRASSSTPASWPTTCLRRPTTARANRKDRVSRARLPSPPVPCRCHPSRNPSREAAMAVHSGNTEMEINLTPLLDLILQLVMFFLACANFAADQASSNVQLPLSTSAQEIQPKTEDE